MIAPAYPIQELKRQEAVESYQLLDSPPELSFDGITQLAAASCDTPVALLTLLDGDRNWFKSKIGVPFEDSPRAISFCGHAILQPNDIMIVNDARKDKRFADNPLVAEMKAAIFYCGVPVKSNEGLPLGTLCVFDNKPRRLSKKKQKIMKALGFQAEQLLEQRRHVLKAKRYNALLIENNKTLSNFAEIAAHDLKLPLASIVTSTDIIKSKYKTALDDKGLERLDLIKKSAFTLNNYITAMLEYYSADVIGKKEFSVFNLNNIINTVLHMLLPNNMCEFIVPKQQHIINTNELALIQILSNLFGNALKYCNVLQPKITVGFTEDIAYYYFSVKDNGKGIPKAFLPKVFEMFTTAKHTNANVGTGIGLSTVKRLVTKLKGEITISSEIGKGTEVNFSLKKPTKQYTA